jgi:acetylornithine deacetylase/succinyl-diaminopimelate desuccinylase-like protein
MAGLVRFLGLSGPDRRLVLRAAAWLAVVRLALWTRPFARVRELVAVAADTTSRAPAVAPGRLAWAIEAAAQAVPGASCLTQALAAEIMLERSGEHPELKIGVATDREAFEAHAWLELDGRPLVGARDLERYAELGAR